MRKSLDRLYSLSGGLAALFICLICVLVCAKVAANIITRIGLFGVNLTIPSYADFAGYFLASASFLALAYTLTRGGHIRVTLLTGIINEKAHFLLEVMVLALCSAAALFTTWYVGRLVMESWEFGDVSSGIIAVPIFIPQLPILAGLSIFSIALIDLLFQTIAARKPVITAEPME